MALSEENRGNIFDFQTDLQFNYIKKFWDYLHKIHPGIEEHEIAIVIWSSLENFMVFFLSHSNLPKESIGDLVDGIEEKIVKEVESFRSYSKEHNQNYN